MPKTLQYRTGSVIYFQGDAGDKIYILQAGSVNLSYQDIETGQDVHDAVLPGEFFGVKSALGRYPREENAITMLDSTVMSFTVPEFEQLAMANTRIIIKMLKVFSTQLRRVHRQVNSLMESAEQESSEAGLFNIGQYYLKNRRFAQARYMFSRYLTYYPSGRNAAQAAKDLETAENYIARYGTGKAPAAPSPSEFTDVGDSPAMTPRSSVSAPSSGDELSDSAKAYYDAVSFITQEKYQQAYMALRKIVDDGDDEEYTAKSSFEIGRCFFLMGKYEDCIKYYTQMITKYPKHPDLPDALFYMGQSYEKRGLKDQAVTFYKKIMSLSSDDDNGTHIKARRALKALEA